MVIGLYVQLRDQFVLCRSNMFLAAIFPLTVSYRQVAVVVMIVPKHCSIFIGPSMHYGILPLTYFKKYIYSVLLFWSSLIFPGRSVDRKLQLTNLEVFALSPGKPPYKLAVYVPGTKASH